MGHPGLHHTGKAFLQECVGLYGSLGEAPNPKGASHFKVNASVMDLVCEAVLMLDDPRWEKGESDAHIFIQVEGSRKGKFFYEHAVPL